MTKVEERCSSCDRTVLVDPHVYIGYGPFCKRCEEIAVYHRQLEDLRRDYQQRMQNLTECHLERLAEIDRELEREGQP